MRAAAAITTRLSRPTLRPSLRPNRRGACSGAARPSRRRRRSRCLIKGNISFETGEPIYHVPGQEYYDETVINEAYGERWFCTEEEAQAAGWRRSDV